MKRVLLAGTGAMFAVVSAFAFAGGGPLGIDHKLKLDTNGIWSREVQKALLYTLEGVTVGGALWEGGDSRPGNTFWQSLDASVAGALASETIKRITTRVRPSDTDDPDLWFQHGKHRSFPSGEVTAVSSIITPFILEYRHEYPAVYALEVLPLYDGIARMKTHAHWQTDVLAGFALGTTIGYLSHQLDRPIIIRAMPHGIQIGLKANF